MRSQQKRFQRLFFTPVGEGEESTKHIQHPAVETPSWEDEVP
jgi:hypothetical protein